MKVKTKLMLVAVMATMGVVGQAQAWDKAPKQSKTAWTCRVPLIRSTPLCPDYNRRMIERYAPKVPSPSDRGRYYAPTPYRR